VPEGIAVSHNPSTLQSDHLVTSGNGWGSFQLLGEGKPGKTIIQQDRLRVIENWMDGTLFLLCDGHANGGDLAAQLVIDQFPDLLLSHDFIHQRFVATERACVAMDRVIEEQTDGGTTLALVHITQRDIFVVNLGDTRVSTLELQRLRSCTRDHRVASLFPEDELKIRRRGGLFIQSGKQRFLASLDLRSGIAITHTLGDRRYGRGASTFPTIVAYSWEGMTDATHLILWVDGVWETFEEAIITTSLLRYWIRSQTSVRESTQELSQQLVRCCPGDNASAIVIDLDHFRPPDW